MTATDKPNEPSKQDGSTMSANPRSSKKIVGVRFMPSGKVHFFAPGNVDVRVGDTVEVETDVGYRQGTVVIAPDQIRYADLRGSLDTIVRKL